MNSQLVGPRQVLGKAHACQDPRTIFISLTVIIPPMGALRYQIHLPFFLTPSSYSLIFSCKAISGNSGALRSPLLPCLTLAYPELELSSWLPHEPRMYLWALPHFLPLLAALSRTVGEGEARDPRNKSTCHPKDCNPVALCWRWDDLVIQGTCSGVRLTPVPI